MSKVAEYDGVRFTAREAEHDCKGCLYDGCRSTECRNAGIAAVQAGLPDCEAKSPSGRTYIYVEDDSDPRQIDLIESLNP